MEEASGKLEKTAKDIEMANKESIKNIVELREEMSGLKKVLKDIPKETVEQMQYGLKNVEATNMKNGKGWLK